MSASIAHPLAAKVLDSMPGLVGAIDQTFIDQTGEKVAFVLVAFVAGAAVHATNINPPEGAIVALMELVKNYNTDAEGGTLDVTGAIPE